MRKWIYLTLFVGLAFFLFSAESNFEKMQDSLDYRGWFTIIVFGFVFAGLVTEFRPPDIVMLFGAGVLTIFGILTPRQFLEGFSNPIVMTIAMLCIVVRAMEVNGLLEIVARNVLSKSKKFIPQMLSMCFPVFGASAFLNNTPIVLLMTPLVRKWALRKKLFPSKFLIPLSYAAIMGGACTLIGTSTNLIIYGLFKIHLPEATLGFFDFSYVALPFAIIGLSYLILASPYLLPERVDPASAITEETREFTAEFIIGKQCPLANKTVKEAARRYFRHELLIQIERNQAVIDSPRSDLVLFVGDRLVFVGDINQIAELHAIKDLNSATDPQFKLDTSSSHFAEIVVPTTSSLVGKSLRKVNFRRKYGASVLAIYRQGWRVHGDIRETELQAGDTLMLLSGEPWDVASYYGRDFYYIRHHEKLVAFHPLRALLVTLTLFSIVIAAAAFGLHIMICSLAGAFVLLVSRCISIREAQNSIMWNVLLLIACSFALGRAMETTGVASYLAGIILTIVGNQPYFFIGAIIATAILLTEIMTNNAAALILFPIAFSAAKLAGYTSPEAIKAVSIAVAFGASSSYAIPTGYQTNMIVYGPGGYKFTDFLKIGIPLDLLAWLTGTLLIPKMWPLH